MKGGAKLKSKTNFDFRLFDPEDSLVLIKRMMR